MKKSYFFLCFILMFTLITVCFFGCDTTSSNNNLSSPTTTTKYSFPSRENSYSKDLLKDVDFRCGISYGDDKFQTETEVKGEIAITLYNDMAKKMWKPATEDYQKNNPSKMVCLNFYNQNYYYNDNCYGYVYVGNNDIVMFTNAPSDQNICVYKAPKGTYDKIMKDIKENVK